MAKAVGTYYFKRLRNRWAVYVVVYSHDGIEMGDFVKEAYSFNEAMEETYKLNGWSMPQNIVRKY